MDEFAALAQRVVLTMDDVRGCLVLSRDGLVLGAFPEDREAELKPAWLRFVHVGEARKGFVEFSDQLWAFVHRGPYAAFVVTGTSVRPGVMLDQLEQAVIAAEESRAKQKEVTLKVPDAASAPSGRPRTSLHPPADRPAAAPVASTPAPAAEEIPSFAAPTTGPDEFVGAASVGGGDPAQQEMQAMREQMAAMQAELDQRALAGAAPAAAPPAVAPENRQPLSGYRRPEPSAAPAPTPTPTPEAAPSAEVPAARTGADLSSRARPSIEGTTYESTLPDDPSSGFASESSPFARLDAERTAAENPPAEGQPAESPPAQSPPAETAEAAQDAGAFRQEPQRLVSAEPPTPEERTEEDDPPEVDRVLLAKEFSGLLQVGEDGDED